MAYTYKLGVIGAGNMASAIIGGILKENLVTPNAIIISDLNDEKLNYFKEKGINTTKDNSIISNNCEYILFAVKPQSFPDIAEEIKSKISKDAIIISIMAGVSIKKLESYFGNINIARIMPNTPALVGQGMSAITFNKVKSDFVINIFKSLGKVVELDENKFDAVTSLSGSGPAYVYYFIKSLIEGGIDGGLDPDTSKTLALQTILGSVKMVETSPLDIDTLINNVCSKGGTTIEAINSFKEDNIEGCIRKGIKKCKEKSEILGK